MSITKTEIYVLIRMEITSPCCLLLFWSLIFLIFFFCVFWFKWFKNIPLLVISLVLFHQVYWIQLTFFCYCQSDQEPQINPRGMIYLVKFLEYQSLMFNIIIVAELYKIQKCICNTWDLSHIYIYKVFISFHKKVEVSIDIIFNQNTTIIILLIFTNLIIIKVSNFPFWFNFCRFVISN